MGVRPKHGNKQKSSHGQLEKIDTTNQDDYTSDWPQEELKTLLLNRIADDSEGVSSQEEYRARRHARSTK